jgi:REP element-mobilizing transposase RayT
MEGLFRRRRLPHWDVADAPYFVTACLADSIPARGLADLAGYRDRLAARPRPSHFAAQEWERHKQKLLFARVDRWLDQSPAVNHLEAPELARIVRRSVYHFVDLRYHLLAYVVMPSHLHWVFQPLPAWSQQLIDEGECRTPREVIMHSLKSFTGLVCNRWLQRQGAFWQDESYDHWVRDEEELYRIIDYVEQNPVKAGLVSRASEWRFSSAFDRVQWGICIAEPLVLPGGPGIFPAGW